jgi:hypothetical protein
MEVAALEREIVRHGVERRLVTAEAHQIAQKNSCRGGELDPDEPIVMGARVADEDRAARRGQLRHQ